MSNLIDTDPISGMLAGARLCSSIRIGGTYYGCRFRIFSPDSLWDPRDMVAVNTDMLFADGRWDTTCGETVGLAAAYMVMGV